VCPSIFSGGIGSLTVGGLNVITREDQTALGSQQDDNFLQVQNMVGHFRFAGQLQSAI
jgi:hypothetical protein